MEFLHMGIFSISNFEKDNFEFNAFTSTSDLKYPESGCVTINVTCLKSKMEYYLNVCVADFTEKWFDKFAKVFCVNTEFRKQFIEKTVHDKEHPQKIIQLHGVDVEIDSAISDAIIKLNDVGAITQWCCQGSKKGESYIDLKHGTFPYELITAWLNAGYIVSPKHVSTLSAFGVDPSHNFIDSLNDWLVGDLDMSGLKYRVTTKRESSLPVLPAIPAASLDTIIEKFVSKGNKLKFKDYMTFKSGRDKFSNMSTKILIDMCPQETTDLINRTFSDQKNIDSSMRWYLRGLPIDMAIHKVKVDIEISKNSHTK